MGTTGRSLLFLLTALWYAACAPETVPDDGGASDGAAPDCTSDDDCDDGVFCNGAEQCEGSVCVDGSAPCGDEERCAEGEGCVPEGCPDADEDGHRDTACGGADCDDTDASRYPGAAEVCDVEGRDEDCDPRTFGFRDADGDGHPDEFCCNTDTEGTAYCGDDCADARPNAHPGLAEACDELDNDCDGAIDEDVLRTFYVDADGDLYGDASLPTVSGCSLRPDYSETAGDCDDTRGSVHPAAPELCDDDGRDENCDGVANPASLCDCEGDVSRGCLEPGRCAAGMQRCVGGSWGACSVGPSMELCNGEDDDCDSLTDEAGPERVFYRDVDGDNYGVLGSTTLAASCVAPSGFSPRSDDCDDGDMSVHPDAVELCDRVDSNCSVGGGIEAGEDADDDGHAPIGHSCVDGTLPEDDCDDTRAHVFPSACEQWNGIDDDCNGSTDGGTGCANGQVCNPFGVCVACGAGSLAGDCGPGAGCETNLATQTNHCGACGVSCTSTQVCLGGVCRSGNVRRVFMATSARTGGFGSLAAMDNLCMDFVNAATIFRGRTFMAWASDATSSPATRFTTSGFDYVLLDGSVIANGWADLTDGTLDHAINANENGQLVGAQVWTGTASNGTASGAHCSSWGSSSSAVTGTRGESSSTTAGWTNTSDMACSNTFSFYCFEQ